jgi:hypothetical protein
MADAMKADSLASSRGIGDHDHDVAIVIVIVMERLDLAFAPLVSG